MVAADGRHFRIFQAGIRAADGSDPDDPGAVHFRVADDSLQGDVLQFTIKQRGAAATRLSVSI